MADVSFSTALNRHNSEGLFEAHFLASNACGLDDVGVVDSENIPNWALDGG